MLTLYTASGAMPLAVDDYYIKELASGLDELCFSISIWDPLYVAIQEESSIKEESADGSAFYLVKAIDGGGSTASIKCQIDLDEWKTAFYVPYNSGSNSIGDIVTAIKPAGWSVVNNSGITYKRTIALDAATPMDVLEHIAKRTNTPIATIVGVATFYAQFRLEPVGKYLIMLCQGTACHVNGSELISSAITDELGIEDGQTTPDGLFSLEHVACLGCCSLSPVMMINGRTYSSLTPDKARKVIRDLAAQSAKGDEQS
jgi:NADH-quinone oxidoreductase subunit E